MGPVDLGVRSQFSGQVLDESFHLTGLPLPAQVLLKLPAHQVPSPVVGLFVRAGGRPASAAWRSLAGRSPSLPSIIATSECIAATARRTLIGGVTFPVPRSGGAAHQSVW